MNHHFTFLRFFRPSPARLVARTSLLASAMLLVSMSTAAQGETGFLRGKGKTDVVVTYTNDHYRKFWAGNDKMKSPGVGKVTRQSYSLYAAYGLTDKIDLIVNGSYVKSDSSGAANAPTEDDWQDLIMAAKWRFWEHTDGKGGELSLAALPGIKLPMDHYEDNAITAIGDGQTDLQFRLVGMYRFPNGAFAALESGYDRRNGAPKDAVPINFTIGATVVHGLTLSAFLSHVDSLGGTDIGPPGTNYFPANEEDYTRTGLSAYYRLNEWFGLTGTWRTTLDGKNTGDIEGFSAGVVVNFL